MDGQQFFLLFGVLTSFAAFVQGFTGLGFGIIVMAGISFLPVDMERISVALNLLLIILNSTIIFAGRRDFSIDWRLVWLIVLGETVGVPLGYWFIFVFGSRPEFRLALGVALLLMAANQLARPRIKKKLGTGFGLIAGALGGFLAGAFTAAGPPIAYFVYSRHSDPAKCKGTLQFVFLTATSWRLLNILFFGKGITAPVLRVAIVGLPLVILFTALGHVLTRRVSQETFLKIVFSVIALAGVVNIIRVLR